MGDRTEKVGIDLVIDLVEAVRVRLDSAHEGGWRIDEIAPLLGHCSQLCKDALVAARTIELSNDRITALLALPADCDPMEVALAVEIAIKRLQELELKIAQLRESHL